jgi:hypothetical protein
MYLHDLLHELQNVGITVVGKWEMYSKKGVTLGDPKKSFPNPTGPQYQVNVTDTDNPDLTDLEVRTIRRRFGIAES